ncbi:MAG: electron transport complex subunit RsxG [Gammaproteobacteria bacterium]|nr:electron transport complex subunit RsxG [Gammaproteobacteria bacterium]
MANFAIMRSGLTLAAIAAVCTTLVAFTYQLTDERIEANEQAWLEQSLQPALSGLFFDSGVSESVVTIPAPHELPGSEDAIIYRVYSGETPVAALFVVSARDGYAGAIKMLVGVDINGAVTGVHVLAHRETPGLGDRIESTKSDWVRQFNGRSLQDPEGDGWKIRRDGGEFDQLTGASGTPRAAVKAIRETLQYFDANAVAIFSAAADQEDEVSE